MLKSVNLCGLRKGSLREIEDQGSKIEDHKGKEQEEKKEEKFQSIKN